MAIEKIELEDGTYECHVVNYLQIKEAFDDDTISKVYLDSDINCNDLGDFEWDIKRENSNITFNLCGHTIKNIMIKHNCGLFVSNSKFNINIENGYILNIFNNLSNCIAKYTNLNNVSLSINGNGIQNYAFNCCVFNFSTIYFESYKLNNSFFYNSVSSSVKNSDIYLKIYDTNNQTLFYSGGTTVQKCTIDGSRIRGRLGLNSNVNYVLSDKPVVNSVINIEIPEYKSDNTLKLTEEYIDLKNTGVINVEIINGGDESTYTIGDTITKCNSECLRNGEWLNTNGFAVVQISNN